MSDPTPIRFSLASYFTPGSHKVALSVPELAAQTNEFSTKNRPGCKPKFVDSEADELWLRYQVTCNLKESDPNGHDVRVRFDLDAVTDETTAKNLDVKASCSCVAPETMVRMWDGTEKRIDRIIPGERVITHKGRARPVTHVVSRPALPLEIAWKVEAVGYRDPLILSDDHPLGLVRGHQLCACGCGEPLSPLGYASKAIRDRWSRKWLKGHGRRAEDRPDTLSEGKFDWKKPFELVRREQLFFPRITWPGTTTVDSDLASLVGYYLAEGSVPLSVSKVGRWGNILVCAKSREVLFDGTVYRARNVIFTLNQNERHTIAADIVKKAAAYCGPATRIEVEDREHDGRKWLTVTVYSPELAVRCIELVGRGSGNKRLSDEVIGWSTHSMMQLLSSYALGDGYVGDDAQCVFSISRDLISQVSMFLYSIGVWHGWTYHLKNDSKNTSFRLNWNYRDYPQVLEHMLDRMRDEDKHRALGRLAIPVTAGDSVDRLWGPGYIRSLLKKERIAAPAEFYDLTVEEDESFLANGIVVHNCPAFLWWGAQWNMHQRDALEGEPRPLLTAPTERLDLRGRFVICKHCAAVFERILPSVQHNIVKILRQREVEKRQKEEEQQPRMRRKRTPAAPAPVPATPAAPLAPPPSAAPPGVIKRDTPATPGEKRRVPKLDREIIPVAPPAKTPPARTPIPTIDDLDDEAPSTLKPFTEEDRRATDRIEHDWELENQQPYLGELKDEEE